MHNCYRFTVNKQILINYLYLISLIKTKKQNYKYTVYHFDHGFVYLYI